MYPVSSLFAKHVFQCRRRRHHHHDYQHHHHHRHHHQYVTHWRHVITGLHHCRRCTHLHSPGLNHSRMLCRHREDRVEQRSRREEPWCDTRQEERVNDTNQ